MDEDLELYSILLRLAVALIYGFIIFFLPALFAKKVFLKGEPSSKKRKLVILAVALSTLAIYLLLEVGLGGAIPKIKVWVNWMFVDYFFLFRTRVKKESLNTNLHSELSEYEESKKVGSSQTDSNVKSIEPSDSQREPAQQPDEKSSLLSQLSNLSEDELKAVVKLASVLSSEKDKQKD